MKTAAPEILENFPKNRRLGIPAPGELGGPCITRCHCEPCHVLREIADLDCPFCLHPIGFNREFVNCQGFGFVHLDCFQENGGPQNA